MSPSSWNEPAVLGGVEHPPPSTARIPYACHETAARFQCVCFIVVTNVGQGNRRVGCPVNGMLVYPLSGVN